MRLFCFSTPLLRIVGSTRLVETIAFCTRVSGGNIAMMLQSYKQTVQLNGKDQILLIYDTPIRYINQQSIRQELFRHTKDIYILPCKP